jgi:hypothetical protein
LAAHQFVEPTVAFLLIEERQLAFIEFLKEIIPRYLFESTFAAESGKIDAQDARFAALFRPPNGCRMSSALFRPTPDLVVVGGDS